MKNGICALCQRIFNNDNVCKYTIIEDGKRKEMINFCPKKKRNKDIFITNKIERI